jgi:hypothetical protein
VLPFDQAPRALTCVPIIIAKNTNVTLTIHFRIGPTP